MPTSPRRRLAADWWDRPRRSDFALKDAVTPGVQPARPCLGEDSQRSEEHAIRILPVHLVGSTEKCKWLPTYHIALGILLTVIVCHSPCLGPTPDAKTCYKPCLGPKPDVKTCYKPCLGPKPGTEEAQSQLQRFGAIRQIVKLDDEMADKLGGARGGLVGSTETFRFCLGGCSYPGVQPVQPCLGEDPQRSEEHAIRVLPVHWRRRWWWRWHLVGSTEMK
ncbi:hypothetical protein F4780DRAFT_287019 [Xylariomycetidae sp. FL0641]|nr:hypothetical protein F4780DRAFT_287019 [Xylariomycetidae sp. FL0641]